MKLHIIKRRQLWHCRTGDVGLTGLGFTPSDAYLDWIRRNYVMPDVWMWGSDD